MPTAYVALGTNLGPGERIFGRALALLEAGRQVRVAARSRWHRTPPMGPSQPAYLNGVIRVETELGPEVLLSLLQRIERLMGRPPRRRRWGPRILDLDLVRYGDLRILRRRLVVPHGTGRPFVAGPLAEVEAP